MSEDISSMSIPPVGYSGPQGGKTINNSINRYFSIHWSNVSEGTYYVRIGNNPELLGFLSRGESHWHMIGA